MAFGNNAAKSHKPKAGALWKRVSKEKGTEFFAGKLEVNEELIKRIQDTIPDEKGRKQIDLVVFSNEKEPGTNFPDFNIFLSEKR